MTDHTPGPWTLIEDGQIVSSHNVRGHEGLIAQVYRYGTAAEARQNERLLAAAPELLATVEELREFCSFIFDRANDLQEAMDRADAVIAKARGHG